MGMRQCGDRGHVTLKGEPCPAPIGKKAKGCFLHSMTPEQRKANSKVAQKIGELLGVKDLEIDLSTRAGCRKFLADLVPLVLRARKKIKAEAVNAVRGLVHELLEDLPPEPEAKPGIGGVRVILSSESESGCRHCLCTRCTTKFAGWSEQREIKPTVVSGAPDGDYDRRPLPEPVTTLVPEPVAPRLVYANGQPARKNMAYRKASA